MMIEVMKAMMIEVMKAMMIEVMKAMIEEVMKAMMVEVMTNLMKVATNAKIIAIAAPKIQSAGNAARSARKITLEVITNLMEAMMTEVIVVEVMIVEGMTNLMKAMMVEVIVVEVMMAEVMTNLMKEATIAKSTAIAAVEIGGAR